MRWVFALLSSAALALTLANAARAQSATEAPGDSEQPHAPFLQVTREEGAESCPDTQHLAEHVERVRGHQATSEPSAYRVGFSHRGGVFRASIQLASGSGVRVLRDRGQTCASLAQATALTLALLLDSDGQELPLDRTEPEPPEPEPAREPRPFEAERPSPARPTPARLTLSLGGGALFGVSQTAAPALVGELGIGVRRFRTSLGVLWVPTQKLDFGPGQLRETLLSGVARTCLALHRASRVRLDFCSGIYAGLMKVEAKGYTRNGAANKPWLALPLELSVSTTAAPLGVEVAAAALLPLRRSDFSIDNVGVAYDSWPVGMSLSLRAVGAWLL